jgi:N-sulfoglucosamine sulfohydrolase
VEILKETAYRFHGRSFLPTLGHAETAGWDCVTASHTFHEIQMYYPKQFQIETGDPWALKWNYE